MKGIIELKSSAARVSRFVRIYALSLLALMEVPTEVK